MNVLKKTQKDFNQVYDNEYQLLVAKYYEEINHAEFIIINKDVGFIVKFSASNTGVYEATSDVLLGKIYELKKWIKFLDVTRGEIVND